jgi:hypothetical protein
LSGLTRHLREPGDHGALAFHPDCPICRDQRLNGTIEDRPLVSVRAQAAFAAGVLAVAAVGPVSAGVASSEPPSEHEGEVAPEAPGAPGDSSQSPDYDPGGPQTELPGSAGPEDPADESDAPEPLESEPVTDPGVVPEPPGAPDVPTEPPIEEQPVPVVSVPEAPAPDPPPAPEALELSPPAVGTAPVEAPSAPDVTKPTRGQRDRGHRRVGEKRERRPPASSLPQETPEGNALQTETVAVETQPVAVDVPASVRVKAGDRVHVVERGESLWSIAKPVVGQDASIAEVAREVSRLWELNRERIGTGDPDLILQGTRLLLR